MKKRVYFLVGVVAAALVLALLITSSIWPVLNTVDTGQTPQYAQLQPHYYSAEPARIFEEAQALIAELERWELVDVDYGGLTLGATRDSRLPGLDSHLRIRVESVTEFVSQVHLQSRTEPLPADFGENARAIQEFLGELDERLGAVKFEPRQEQDEREAEERPGESDDQSEE